MFFNVCLHSRSFLLLAGELEEEFKFQRRRLCKLHCITIQTWRMGAVGFDWCIAIWFRDWVQLCDLCSLGGEGGCVIYILWRGWCKRDSVLLYRYWWNTRIFPFTKKTYLHRARWRYFFYLSRVRILVLPWLLT